MRLPHAFTSIKVCHQHPITLRAARFAFTRVEIRDWIFPPPLPARERILSRVDIEFPSIWAPHKMGIFRGRNAIKDFDSFRSVRHDDFNLATLFNGVWLWDSQHDVAGNPYLMCAARSIQLRHETQFGAKHIKLPPLYDA
jgi:hypothetical protein